MRKLTKWTPEEVAPIYWLTLWGLKPKEVHELVIPLLPNRSLLSIDAQTTEVRKFVAALNKVELKIPPSNATKKIVRLASKIPARKEIADLAPVDLTKVVYSWPNDNGQFGKHKKNSSRNFEQLKDGEKNPRSEKLHFEGDDLSPLRGTQKEFEKHLEIVGKQTELFPPYFKTDKVKAIKTNDFDNLERVLNIAKEHGAKKVEWNGYTIKF